MKCVQKNYPLPAAGFFVPSGGAPKLYFAVREYKSGISRHIANILKEGELPQETTVAKIATVVNRGIRGNVLEDVVVSKMEIATPHGAIEGKTQMSETAFYSLDGTMLSGIRKFCDYH